MFDNQLKHPLTGAPIVPLGYRKSGAPIWPILGGSEAAGGDGGDGAGPGEGDTSTGTETAATNTDTDTTETDTGKDTPWTDPAKAKAEIERLRRENASDRTKAKEQAATEAAEKARTQLAQEIGKALGLVEGEKAPTVEQLTKELTDQKATTETVTAAHRESQAELVVWRTADELKIDAQAVTDSRAFAAAIKDLDPASATFAADVKKAAQEAAEKNPKLKAVPVAGKGGAEITGGSGESGAKAKSLEEAISAKLAG